MVQAQRIYNACQAYASVRGALPGSLEDLVPDFLPDAEPLRDPGEPGCRRDRLLLLRQRQQGDRAAGAVFLASKSEVRGQRVVVQFGGKVARRAFQPPSL